MGTLPYDTIVTEAMVQGQPVTAYQPKGAMARALQEMWDKVSARLEE